MNIKKENNGLTDHPSGGLKEIWVISWPMMLATLSGYLMILIDRIILSKYSQNAFIAISSAQSWYWTISFSLMALISITEVFVGQYNGSKNYQEIRKVVWQMIWASFGAWIFLIPLIFLDHFFTSPQK